MFEVREVVRLWLHGEGLRAISRLAGMDRKTVRRYVEAAEELGLDRGGGDGQLTDVLIGQVVERVRPDRTDGRGEAWRLLDAHRDQLPGVAPDAGQALVEGAQTRRFGGQDGDMVDVAHHHRTTVVHRFESCRRSMAGAGRARR